MHEYSKAKLVFGKSQSDAAKAEGCDIASKDDTLKKQSTAALLDAQIISKVFPCHDVPRDLNDVSRVPLDSDVYAM